MTAQDQNPSTKGTPGAVITAYAFKYSGTFYAFADQKFPELKGYPPDNGRGTLLQAAIIVSTLIHMERATRGAGRDALHAGVEQAFAPSVQRRHHAAIQDLACALIERRRGELKDDAIPSFETIAGAPDQKLMNAIGLWLVLSASKKPQLDPADEKLAAAIGRSAWTSGKMISRMLLPKQQP
ncbi:MAG: hypothetical protein ACHQ51_02230 [Elusimicrobiota bacterium]